MLRYIGHKRYLDDVASCVDSQYDVLSVSSPAIYNYMVLVSLVHQDSCLSSLHRIDHLLMCRLLPVRLSQRWYACNVVSERPTRRAR